MASKTCGDAVPHLFPSLGPALLISMGYIDLGKWVAAVDGGARFGFDLVLVVLVFNCTAILCQYLSTCIGIITEKNLAEICNEEYCKVACTLLGVQAELSMIISELTTILGISYGLNLLFGVDLFACIFLAIAGNIVLLFVLTFVDDCKAEALYISIAGFALAFYVLGVLISQPEVPLVMNGIFPKMSGESAYSVMALLGANIMAHNFYTHSSIVKQQRRRPNVALGALFHDHFFAILFIFTGIFLVNYVLMNSAAAVFGSTDVVFSFQEISILMDQIFRSPIAPIAFFLVLFLSGQITALTRNIGGQVILQCFFGTTLPSWVHCLFVKALIIIPALYCAKNAGAEGIYQLLILCQVILAMLLPSSVIPLFRVASSRLIMGAFKISWYTEIVALSVFLMVFASNVFFVIEMFFGNSSWMINLMGSTESIVMIPYSVLLVIASASIGSTLYLAVTPLKSASESPDTQIWTRKLQQDLPELSEGREENDLDVIKYDEDQESVVESALEKSMESQSDKSMLQSNLDPSETAIDSDHDSQQSAQGSSITVCASPMYHPEESKSELKSVAEVDMIETREKASVGGSSHVDIYQRIESKDPVGKDMGAEAYVHVDRDNEEGDALELEESFKGAPQSSTSEGPESVGSVRGKGSDDGNGSASLSKLSGLGRAARRQLASILDEFWGKLFDFHGKLTQEANTNRLDVLLGLDLRPVGSLKAAAMGAESSKSFFPDADVGSIFPTNSRDYSSPNQNKNISVDLPFGVQRGSSSWSQSMQSLNMHTQSSSSNLSSEKLFSSLHLPQYSDNREYQPATIHGYQVASYLRGSGAARTPYSSSISQNLPPTPNSTASSMSTLRDQVMYSRGQNELGSLGTSGLQNPALSRISRFQVDNPYYESSFGEASENVGSSACPKKYHSSPDISALIALSRNAYLNEGKRGSPIGPRLSSGRMASEKSQYLNPVSRVPLAFDQLSPPKLHRDVFSLQPSLNPDAKSLWSKQPFEQLFGMTDTDYNRGDGVVERPNTAPKETFPYAESGAKLLQSLRFCIMKLLKLEGSEWLFGQNGGYDEELIDQVAATEKYLLRVDTSEQVCTSELQHLSSDRKFSSFQKNEVADLPSFQQSIPNCGDCCIWRAALVVSFGVWCIRRILELSLVESRPELWGKYTYVLNRLQGIIEPAFSKPRQPLALCSCLKIPLEDAKRFSLSAQNGLIRSIEKPTNRSLTSGSMILEIIKDVETAVSGRKGRTGTAAGDVAFPKGKENLASVLKRYKRRLLNKTHDGPPSFRRIPSSTTSSVL